MPKVGSGLGTILSASELPTAVMMSTLILHEAVTYSQWFGVIMILCGIAFPNIQRRSVRSYNERGIIAKTYQEVLLA